MTTKEIRVMLQEIYVLGDAIRDRIGKMLDRESSDIRGTLEVDMLRYLIHLSEADGTISEEEWKVIEEFTDVNLAEVVKGVEDFDGYLYYDYYGMMDEEETPVSVQIFKLAEDVLFGDQSGSLVKKLVEAYKHLGYGFLERVDDKRCFILERHERFIDRLKAM